MNVPGIVSPCKRLAESEYPFRVNANKSEYLKIDDESGNIYESGKISSSVNLVSSSVNLVSSSVNLVSSSVNLVSSSVNLVLDLVYTGGDFSGFVNVSGLTNFI